MVGETGPVGPRRVTRYEWEPSYVGIQTFLKLPLCLSPEDLRAGAIDIAIGGIPWDGHEHRESWDSSRPASDPSLRQRVVAALQSSVADGSGSTHSSIL